MTPPDQAGRDPVGESARLHWRALEGLYGSAPVNDLFESRLEILAEGRSRIHFNVTPACFHAAGAAHGTVYFKMLDDAAFYAANTHVTDRFLLTTSFNLLFTKPIKAGPVIAEGQWISGRRRVLVAEARLIDAEGEEVGRGTGTFQRSRIPLSSLDGYNAGLRKALGQVETRLPAHMEVAGLLRAAQAEGDFGMVLHKGDRDGGTILVVLLDKQGLATLYERMPERDGSRKWSLAKSQVIDNKSEFEDYLDRRKRQDPDLWIVELTVAKQQRFIQQCLTGN